MPSTLLPLRISLKLHFLLFFECRQPSAIRQIDHGAKSSSKPTGIPVRGKIPVSVRQSRSNVEVSAYVLDPLPGDHLKNC